MSIELLNIDCMEYMAGLPDKAFDLAIVDPPYRDNNQPTQEMRKNGSMKTLEGRPTPEYWKEIRRVSKEQIILRPPRNGLSNRPRNWRCLGHNAEVVRREASERTNS